jgi:hypothetical protein
MQPTHRMSGERRNQPSTGRAWAATIRKPCWSVSGGKIEVYFNPCRKLILLLAMAATASMQNKFRGEVGCLKRLAS